MRTKIKPTYPKVRALNATTTTILVRSGWKAVTISMEVCSNPKAHRLLWVTPDSYAVRSGQSLGAYVAREVVLSKGKVTCEEAHLDIALDDRGGSGYLAPSQEGKYTLIAKNHHGLSEAHIVITNPPPPIGEKTVSAQKRNTEAADATSQAAIIPTANPFYCLLLVINFMDVGVKLQQQALL